MSDNKKYYDSEGKEIQMPAAAPSKPYYDVNGSPIQLNPRGFGQFGSELETPQTHSDVENVVAPYLGRLAVQAPPIVGSFYGPGGTMIGTGVSQALKAAFPKVFGQPADNILEPGIKDLLLNNAVPGAIEGVTNLAAKGVRALPASGLLRNFPAVREGAARQITSQIMSRFGGKPESQILEGGADVAEANLAGMKGNIQSLNRSNPPTMQVNPLTGQQQLQFHPVVQQAMKDLEDTFGKNRVGQKLVKLQQDVQAGVDVAGSQTYKDISNMALSDLTHVRNWKLAAGPEGIQELAFNKLLTGAGDTIDASKMLTELGGKNAEIYKEAISPAAYEPFKDMLNEIHAQQSGHSVSDSVVRYSKGRLVWAASLLGHGAFGIPGGVAAGTTVTNSMLARAMANPDTARIVVQALRTPASSPQAVALGQALSSIWKAGAGAADAAAEQ